MSFIEGQGILGKIRFVDGEFPAQILNAGRTLDAEELTRIKSLL